eukprot:5934516-Pleurochrysis_carterae.AAC.3
MSAAGNAFCCSAPSRFVELHQPRQQHSSISCTAHMALPAQSSKTCWRLRPCGLTIILASSKC